MEVALTEVDSAAERRTIVLDALPVMIGHGPDVGVRVDDHWASPHHCEINVIKGTLVVRDLGSMLGTFVNGLNVNTALLMPGDKLTVGVTSFLVDYERLIRSRHTVRSKQQAAAEPDPSPPPARPLRQTPEAAGFFPRLLRRLSFFLPRKRGR